MGNLEPGAQGSVEIAGCGRSELLAPVGVGGARVRAVLEVHVRADVNSAGVNVFIVCDFERVVGSACRCA